MASADSDIWQEIAAAQRKRRVVVLATIVRATGSVPRRTGARMLIHPDGSALGTIGGGTFESLVGQDAIVAGKSSHGILRTYSFNARGSGAHAFGAICGGQADVFLDVIMPCDRLLIVGAGHCGRALARAASALGLSIVVADDRAEYACPEAFTFPGVEPPIVLPADYSGLPAPDSATYVAIMTRDHAADEAALRQVVCSPAAFVGMIGSRRKRDQVFARLRATGVPEDALARVHCPIGLEIGAETPEEIAISILAQIIQERASRAHAEPGPAATEAARD
jgi:xanthine dehydrogenase accessory factor